MKKLLLFSCLLMLSAFAGFSQQQEFIAQQWAASTGVQNFFYKNITKSDGASTYTAGATLNSDGNYDLLLVKYNSHGGVVWTKQYNGAGNGHDMATGLHIDGSLNVYVTGTTYVNGTNFNDIITIKYNSSGTQQWLSTYNGSGSSYDAGGAILVDAGGTNVYICGGTMTTSNLSDFIAIKYNASTGAQGWATTYNYNGNYDVAAKLQFVTVGFNTYLQVAGGVQHNSTTWKYATINLNLISGAQVGSATVSGSNTGTADELGDICTDATQTYSYLAASIDNSATGTGFDYKIVKLQNSNLTVVWERTWNGADSLDDKAADVIVDASGNVYVTGFTTTDTQDKNYATVKYNSSGTLQWTKYHNGSGNGRDEGTAINIDASNNVYVTGTSNTGSSLDYYTIKYKPDNTTVWEKSYNGLYNGLDKPYDIAVDRTSNELFISGQTQTATGYSYTIQKLEQVTTVFPSTDEALSSSFSYTENLGQLLDTDGDPADDIDFYSHSSSPSMYFQNGKISYVLSSIDTLTATDDTLHRVDITFPVSKRSDIMGMTKRSDYNNYYLAHIPEGREHVTNYSRLISPNMYDNIDRILGSNSAGFTMRFVCKPGSNPGQIKLSYAGADSIRIVSNDLIIYTKLGTIKHPRLTAKLVDNAGAVTTLGWLPSYVRSGNDITFSLGGLYDTAKNLVFQMGMGTTGGTAAANGNLDWSTYFGGGAPDGALGITTDAVGNVYTTGYTFSFDFPVDQGVFFGSMDYHGGSDIIVGKFSPFAEQLYTVFYGSSDDDCGLDLVVGRNGTDLYVTGTTDGIDFPVIPQTDPSNGTYFDDTWGGLDDAFVLRFKTVNGNAVWAQYIGGCEREQAHAIAADEDGNIYIGAYTSTSEPTCFDYNILPVFDPGNGAYYQEDNLSDYHTGYIIEFDPDNNIKWATYFGGDQHAFLRDITISKQNGDLLIIGEVYGTNTVVVNSPCPSPDNGDFPLCDPGGPAYVQTNSTATGNAFVASFSANDHELEWCSIFGGSGYDVGTAITTNSEGDVYIAGFTRSNTYSVSCSEPSNGGFPLCDPHQATTTASDVSGSHDIFIARFRREELVWSTYYGGASDEFWMPDHSEKAPPHIDTDDFDNLFVLGVSRLHNGVPVDAFPVEDETSWYSQEENSGVPIHGSQDAFLLWFDYWNTLRWASLFGGGDDGAAPGQEFGTSISVYNSETLYIAGVTTSLSTPYECPAQLGSEPPYCDNVRNLGDAFLSRFVIEDLTRVEEIHGNGSYISIYPNPTQGIFTMNVSMEQVSPVTIEVFNNTGQLVSSEVIKNSNKNFSYKVSLEGRPNGIYFVSLRTNERVYSGKVIKQ